MARRRRWVGRDPGVDDEGLARKRAAVQESVRRIAGITDPIEILREVGRCRAGRRRRGRDRRAAIDRSRCVLDGYVVTAVVLPLFTVDPTALDHCTVGHCSAEPGHRRLLERLGKRPLLDLDMRLGEGSGETAAVPPDRDGLCGCHRGADVRGVVRRVTRRAGPGGSPLSMRSAPHSSSRGSRSASVHRRRSPGACRGSRSSAR